MVNHKAKTTFLALALLAQPIYAAHDDGMQPLKAIGIIGGICLGAYALGNGIKYLCTPANQTLVDRACSAEDDAQRSYGSVMQYLKARNYELSQESLALFAQTYISGSIHYYKQHMYDTLQSVHKASNNLSDRMRSIERKGDRGTSDYRTMEDCLNSLRATESSLQRAYDYIERKTGYFVLYATAYETQGVYAEILSIAEQYGHHRASFAQYIREQVALMGVSNHNPYPTIAYVEALSDRIRSLENAIKQCDYHCDVLIKANMMLNKLNQVRTILISDDRYAYEVQDRERARREEERLRIERERVAAERRKAEAAERQNREMARQNDILREQNHIERERNRIERERNERHRYCDRYHCCCDQISECPTIRIELVR